MMDRFILILLGIVVLFSFITYLLSRVSIGGKPVKYSPALLCFLAGLYYLYLAKTVQVGFADLANAIFSMMFFTGFVAGLGMALILDFVVPRFKS